PTFFFLIARLPSSVSASQPAGVLFAAFFPLVATAFFAATWRFCFFSVFPRLTAAFAPASFMSNFQFTVLGWSRMSLMVCVGIRPRSCILWQVGQRNAQFVWS